MEAAIGEGKRARNALALLTTIKPENVEGKLEDDRRLPSSEFGGDVAKRPVRVLLRRVEIVGLGPANIFAIVPFPAHAVSLGPSKAQRPINRHAGFLAFIGGIR